MLLGNPVAKVPTATIPYENRVDRMDRVDFVWRSLVFRNR